MKKTSLVLISIILLSLAVFIISASDVYSQVKKECIKNCTSEKSQQNHKCLDNHKTESKVCRTNFISCMSEARVDFINKTINATEFTKNKRECSKTFLNCTKTNDNIRKNCTKQVKEVNCEKKCEENLVCPTVYEPICGKDNKTYSNECELKKADAKKDCNGVCPCTESNNTSDKSCIDNSECSSTEYCKLDKCDSEKGKCEQTPKYCTMNYNPVCGCDGKTYSNDCVLKGNKVNLDYKGQCINMTANLTHSCSELNSSEKCKGNGQSVCGWYNQSQIMCFRYPCARTYHDYCSACEDKKVDYWTAGKCPTTPVQ